MAEKSLGALQRRIAALKSFQSRLLWPPLTQFEAFGQTYPLPYHSSKVATADVPKQSLEYLAGFFDGDGCVSATGPRRTPTLSMGQTHSSASVLLLFAKVFGGGIYNLKRGCGPQRPALQWIISGNHAKLASERLMPQSFVKRRQLGLAADWPQDECKQVRAKQELARLHSRQVHAQLASAWAGSWEYVAGFFDAEGCIKAPAMGAKIRLSVSQKNRHVLCWIDELWEADFGAHASWYLQKSGATEISVSARYATHRILRRLLSHGLLLKRPQALLALSLEDVPHDAIRNSISQLSGNQGRYQRLTEDGCRRSKAITSTASALRRRQAAGQAQEAAHLLQQLEAMKQQHKILKAVSVYQALRADIRALLAQGSTVSI